MATDLDEIVEDFRHRPLDEAGPFTFVAADALTMKVREGGRVVNAVVLLATGVNGDGHREVLGLRVATSETGSAWNEFFADLTARGLAGVRLVTSDAHQGLKDAIAANLPGATWQRCRTHYSANLMSICLVRLTSGPSSDESESPASTQSTSQHSADSNESSKASQQPDETKTPDSDQSDEAQPDETTSSTQADGQDAGSDDAAGPKLYDVVRVIDGDTVKVDISGGERVRVIGIDTPETVHPVECGGQAATDAAKQLLEGKQVAVVFDESQGRQDKYNRTLAYLDIPGTGDFGEIMLRQGHAAEYTYNTAYKRQSAYRAAEHEARNSDRALWGACGGPDTAAKASEPPPSATPTPTQAPKPAPNPDGGNGGAANPSSEANAPGPGWTNDALTPGYTTAVRAIRAGRSTACTGGSPSPADPLGQSQAR